MDVVCEVSSNSRNAYESFGSGADSRVVLAYKRKVRIGDNLFSPDQSGRPKLVAGLHLAGPNAPKTAVVTLRGQALAKPLHIHQVYEKIGSFGSLFSDERLFEILGHGSSPLTTIFVDCPLSVPPCVACQRPVCPGVVKCEDVGVAYMLALSGQRHRRGKRRLRPINPQSQRLWDVIQLMRPDYETSDDDNLRFEPTYSANKAPLVVRAKTLQRRLNALPYTMKLRETSVPAAMDALVRQSVLPPSDAKGYRDFDRGYACRKKVVETLIRGGWIARDGSSIDELQRIARNVELFEALITAFVAALFVGGLCDMPPDAYIPEAGWVYRPRLQMPLRSGEASIEN